MTKQDILNRLSNINKSRVPSVDDGTQRKLDLIIEILAEMLDIIKKL